MTSLTTSSVDNPLFEERTRWLFGKVGYTPTGEQARILASPARSIIVTGGIHSGKSMMASKKILKELFPDLKRAVLRAQQTNTSVAKLLPLVYWLVGADYDATEREFHYCEADFQQLGLLRRTVRKINPGMLEILGGAKFGRNVIAQIKTKSAKDYQTLRKEAPSGIVPCEASQLDIYAFERLMERMAPMEAWLFMTGTMERGHGWYRQLAQDWSIAGPTKAWFRLKSSSNTYMFPGGENDPELVRQREEMPRSLYEERFEGIPQTPTGLVFPEFRPDLHVAAVEYMEGVAVQVWEDPGYGSESAHVCLAVQIIDGQVRVIDEVYESGLTTDVIIRDILRQKPWWKDVELRVGDPHYGTQHHANTSVDEIWRKMEPRIRSVGKRERLNPRLERTRTMLVPTVHGAPKTVIHPQCRGLLSEVGMCVSPIDGREHLYQYRIDNNGTVIGDEPIDKWNHAWEAFGRGVYWNFGPAGTLATGGKRKFKTQVFGRKRRG